MLHLYAVLPAECELPPGLAGLDGAPVRRVEGGGVAAAASEHEEPELRPTDERVLRHAAVVDAVADGAPAILPARFGDAFPDEAALAARLVERSGELAAGLAAVQGRVELGLRVARRDEEARGRDPAAAPPSGRAYMDALLRRTGETRAIHEPLAALAERSTEPRAGTGGLLLSASYLVRRESLDEFRAEVERLQHEHGEVALVCTGPWPPYSFVPAGGARP